MQNIKAAKVSRAVKAAKTFGFGQSRRPYTIRKEILRGMAKLKQQKPSDESVCQDCASLLELKELFSSFYHSGRALKKRKAAYKKVQGSVYYDVGKQNTFLLQSVFDSNGNYLFHRDCIRAAFGISNQRLARLRKSIQKQNEQPTEFIQKQDLSIRRRINDVVLPTATVNIPLMIGSSHYLKKQRLNALHIQHAMEMLVRNLTTQRVMKFYKSSFSLLIKIQHQMAVKKEVMEKHFILIVSLLKFVFRIKMTLK